MPDIIGWDIGGAHLKVAHISVDGVIQSAHQIACPLWQGLNQLQEAIAAAEQKLDVESLNHCRHSVTMTAELVDLFESRDHGVDAILTLLKQTIESDQLWIFCGRDGLLGFNQVQSVNFQVIASANWLATAMFIADSLSAALVIDIGSTTTDIVAIEHHQILSSAVSDYDRLLTDELVYTGVVRTPVMAVSDHSYFQGKRVPLMAEYFATMADIYRITGELPDYADQGDTADGNTKSLVASTRRLARMIGLDLESAPDSQWLMLAKSLRANQLDKIARATRRVLSTMIEIDVPIIGAGVGRFLVRDVAFQCGLEYRDFSGISVDQAETLETSYQADYAPAVAVASLLHSQLSVSISLL
jgi:probable H4MPT-linked C1 transfer pathway protein